jgi:hypothetical protein
VDERLMLVGMMIEVMVEERRLHMMNIVTVGC